MWQKKLVSKTNSAANKTESNFSLYYKEIHNSEEGTCLYAKW